MLEQQEEVGGEEGSWSCYGDVEPCGHLDRKWTLWHDFMKEQKQLEAWLQQTEVAASSLELLRHTYSTAREELRKVERLRREAATRLVQLDLLTQKNRSLTRMFQGSMRVRLLASARENGRRWEELNVELDSAYGHLKAFISEWEEFEAERAELRLWLAEMDVRLTEIEHLTGSADEKMEKLQALQACVCEGAGRLNVLLQRGETLIQRSEPGDAHKVEEHLLELLRRCSDVYGNIALTHTRLLSRTHAHTNHHVFEDDWASDSGCPSESFHVDGTNDKRTSELFEAFSSPWFQSFPAHEHAGLEWDPSVDVGHSVSNDDADSSYFSADIGLSPADELKRRSYDSRSDISTDITNQEADVVADRWLGSAHSADLSGNRWTTSTPQTDDEPADFDGGRVKAWLSVHGSAPSEETTSCCRASQTDGRAEPTTLSVLQEESERSRAAIGSPRFLLLLLAAAALLLAVLVCLAVETPCHRSNRMSGSFHLSLRYVNGPPPT